MGGLILVSGYFHSLVSLIDILLLPFVSTFFLPYVLDSLLTSPFLIFKILVVVGRERLIGAVCMQPELSAGLKQLLQCGPAVLRGWWNPKHSAIPDAPRTCAGWKLQSASETKGPACQASDCYPSIQSWSASSTPGTLLPVQLPAPVPGYATVGDLDWAEEGQKGAVRILA